MLTYKNRQGQEQVSMWVSTIKKMSAIVSAYQRETEEVEDNEAEIWRPELQDNNRQISRRQMAAVQRIQQNIEDCVPSIRAACKMANDHHKQIKRKSKTTIMQEKRKYKCKKYVSGAIIKFASIWRSAVVIHIWVAGTRNGCFIKKFIIKKL